jgi:hypothetical protein
VRRILTRLSTILATAARDELIPANPAVGADRPATEQQSVQVWEPEAVRIFLQRCAGHRLGAIFDVAVLTGLRRGELTGLRWSDVDLVARKITVRCHRVTVDGKITEQGTERAPACVRCRFLRWPWPPCSSGRYGRAPRPRPLSRHGCAPGTCSPSRMAGR